MHSSNANNFPRFYHVGDFGVGTILSCLLNISRLREVYDEEPVGQYPELGRVHQILML